MDTGVINSAFANVGSYTGGTLSHTVNDITDTLTAGNIYSFKFRALNAINYSEFSEFSEVLRVGLGAQVLAPATISADLTKTGPNYVAITWS